MELDNTQPMAAVEHIELPAEMRPQPSKVDAILEDFRDANMHLVRLYDTEAPKYKINDALGDIEVIASKLVAARSGKVEVQPQTEERSQTKHRLFRRLLDLVS